jgi:hypothetical protein
MAPFLFGPTVNDAFADRFLKAAVDSGRWATFPTSCASWEAATGGLAELPQVLLVWPGYTSVPSWVWNSPVPVVALAYDPNLLWSGFRHTLPLGDLVLTDASRAEYSSNLRVKGLARLFHLQQRSSSGISSVW